MWVQEDMNKIAIPANTDQIAYYAVFSKIDNKEYIQSTTEHKELHTPVELWRELNKKHPDQTHRIYQVLISQIHVPLES